MTGGIPEAVITAVHERSAGHCEACTRPLGPDGGVMHHRLLRSQGGEHTAINLMEIHPVCHNGHTYAIHSRPRRSYRLGHLVSMGTEPADVPVIAEPNLFGMAV